MNWRAATQLVLPALVVVLMALACDESTAPVTIGQPYVLSVVNGQPVPFAFPGDWGDSSTPLMMVEGSVTILNDSIAQRHERLVRTILLSSGDSLPLFLDWTYAGRYRQLPGRLVLTYLAWAPDRGPRQPIDTFTVSSRGLTLREVGFFVPPLDSLVRLYCSAPVPC